MSYRELWVLVKHLPPESWTQTKLRNSGLEPELEAEAPGEYGPWSQTDLLLARLVDEVAWNTAAARWAAGDEKYPAPKPLPRPGVDRARSARPQRSEAQVLYLNNLRARG